MATRGHVQDPNDRRLRPIYDYLDNGNNKMAIQQADKLLKKHKDLHCAKAGMALYKIVPKNPYYFWSVMSLIMQSISARDENLSKTMFLPLAERMVEKMVKEDKIEAEAEVELYYMILERLGKYQEALDVIRGKLGEKLTSEIQSRENKCMAMYKKLSRWPECNALSRRLLLKNSDDWQFYLTYFDSVFRLIEEAWTPPAEGEHSLEGEVHCSAEDAVKFIEDRITEAAQSARHVRGPHLAKLELIRRLRSQGCNDEYKLGDPEELMFQYFKKFGDKPCCFTDLKVFVDLLPAAQCTQVCVSQSSASVWSVCACMQEEVVQELKSRYFFRPAHLAVSLQAEEPYTEAPRPVVLNLPTTVENHCPRLFDIQKCLVPAPELALLIGSWGPFPACPGMFCSSRVWLLGWRSCLKTELQFSDYYCLLAVHVLTDIWREAGEETAVWQALTLLEEGLTHSPSNAQFKLLLVRIYCMLGAFEPVVDLYSSLDAKHIQHDTIGYLLTRYAASLGQYAAASQSCNFALRFFHSNQKDTSEYIIQAYKYGAFEKIPEFIAFRNRLNNSLHFAQVRTERMLLDLLLEANISTSLAESIKSMNLRPEEDDVPWEDLRDNRDLDVFFSWDPKDRNVSEEHKKLSLEEETMWLRIRTLTLRLISGLPSLTHPVEPKNSEKTSENGVSSRIDILRLLLQQLEVAVETGKRFIEKEIQPLSHLSKFAMADVLIICFSILEGTVDIQERIENSLTSLLELLKGVFSTCKGELLEVTDGNVKTQPAILENLVFFVETVSVILWVSSYCESVLRPYKLNIQKKKKKKKETSIIMVITCLPLPHAILQSSPLSKTMLLDFRL
ncbi:N-alpha-acetyltransferase 25, NatB auxiliary subunit [Cricetulus griseus]|uniref:N-alpha-acetyltransferase 25, NatB auxiliary subunit n=1 Tax=Cricetulus griseus TaxID=10029 RepID=A0A061I4F4_CRIGR|nr:N-alpha-acetyltransferase 25, NatB auxiliary subunit [Cricetulus griseus]